MSKIKFNLKKNSQIDEENIWYEQQDMMREDDIAEQFGTGIGGVEESSQFQFTNEELQEFENLATKKGVDWNLVSQVIEGIYPELSQGFISKSEAVQNVKDSIEYFAEMAQQSFPQQPLEIEQPTEQPETELEPAGDKGDLEEGLPAEDKVETDEEEEERDDVLFTDLTKRFDIRNLFKQTKQSQEFMESFGKEDLAQHPLFEKTLNRLRSQLRNWYEDVAAHTDLSDASLSGPLWQALEGALGVASREFTGRGSSEMRRDFRVGIFARRPELVPPELEQDMKNVQRMWDIYLERIQERDKSRYAREAAHVESQGLEPQSVNSAMPGYVKPIQSRITGPTKERILKQYKGGDFARQLLDYLDVLIQNKDERILDPIFERASFLAAYNLGQKENRDIERQAPTVRDDQGEERGIDEIVGGELTTQERVNPEASMTFEERKDAILDSTSMVSNFMGDVWNSLRNYVDVRDIDDPKKQKKIDAQISASDIVKLKNELFRSQVSELTGKQPKPIPRQRALEIGLEQALREEQSASEAGDEKAQSKADRKVEKALKKLEPGEVYSSPRGLLNNKGIIKWNKGSNRSLSDQLSDVINPATFQQYNKDMNEMKMRIKELARARNINPDNYDQYPAIRQEINKEERFQDPVFQSMLNDDRFIRMSLAQSLDDIQRNHGLNEKKLHAKNVIIWSHLSADALIAVARGIQKLKNELKDKDSEIVEERLKEFEIARQNFLTFMKYHSSIDPDKDLNPKTGGHTKLKKILQLALGNKKGSQLYNSLEEDLNRRGMKLDGRAMIAMIGGLIPLPENIVEVLADWGGYEEARSKMAYMIWSSSMYKIAKLNELKTSVIKVASNDNNYVRNINDKIENIKYKCYTSIYEC